MSVVAIIQARMSASRLPGKVLEDIGGKPMLVRVVERVEAAKSIDKVVVATSDQPADAAVEALCKERGFSCFRGHENDVLDRFYRAAESIGAKAGDTLVRITADCPLMDPAVIDKVVAAKTPAVDYATNVIRYTYPDGLDVEVFSFDSLARAWKEATDPVHREHVTPYIRTTGKFQVTNVECETDWSKKDYRWTVDEPADLGFVRAVFERLAADYPSSSLARHAGSFATQLAPR